LAVKSWRLVVTELGGSAPISEASVEAGNWMTALTRAREAIGESGGVPPGASCSVAPDGKVTIQDAVARKAYVLAPDVERSLAEPARPRGPRVPAETVPRQRSAPPPGGGSAGRVSKKTIAYDAKDLGLAPPTHGDTAGETPSKKTIAYDAKDLGLAPPAQDADAGAKAASKRTVAYDAKDLGLAPPAQNADAGAKAASKRTVAYDAKDLGLAPPAHGDTAGAAPSKKTIAYDAKELGLAPPPPTEGAPAERTPPSRKTIAYDAEDLGLAPPPGSQAGAPGDAARPETVAHDAEEPALAGGTPERTTVPDPEPAPGDGLPWELLHARDEEPTKENPLLYRERVFVVPPRTSDADLEAVLRARFEELREELSDRPKGKLVNMALFDHAWEERPERPPLLTLQWKDWRGEPTLTAGPRPGRAAPSPAEPEAAPSPAAEPAPAPAAAEPPAEPGAGEDELDLAISDDVVDAPARASSPAVTGDDRLANAFEALQDLFFLTTPIEGLDFVLSLLEDLVPSVASSALLYDINTDELRFAALRGPGSEERKGDGVPRRSGLLGAATLAPGAALLIDDVGGDGRYDPGVDGRVGLEPRSMALVAVTHQGRLLGLLQLVDRADGAPFDRADANLLTYVAEKLGEFLLAARMRADESRQAP
jgi:hypothetical protein